MLHKLHNPNESCELKFDSKKIGVFEGYASKFGGVDSYGDTILKGAYKKTLKNDRSPSMFVNHDSYVVPVGDWIELSEDENGLFVVGQVDMNHKDGPTVHSALKRGAMDGLSIGYKVAKGGGVENDTGGMDLSEIILREISVVNFPADDAARISNVKQEIEDLKTLKDFELFLRDSGNFSKSAATAFVSRINKLKQGDPAADDKITELKQRIIRDNTQHLIDALTKGN